MSGYGGGYAGGASQGFYNSQPSGGGYSGAPPPGAHAQPPVGGHGQPPVGGPGQAPGYYGGAPAGPPGAGYGAPPAGGYQPQKQSGYGRPPPGPRRQPQQDEMRSWFAAVDQDGSGQINANELQVALVNGDFREFDLATTGMLLNLFDRDRSGTIGFNEFVGLWNYINQWQDIFRQHDRDGSGLIEGRELEEALRQFGFPISPRLVNLLQRKFVPPGRKGPMTPFAGAGGPSLSFDGFVRCCVTVKVLTETFQAADPQRTGYAQVSYEQFLDMAVSAP